MDFVKLPHFKCDDCEEDYDETCAKVYISPTTETSYGIDNKYYIKDVNGNILHENARQDELSDIICKNKYTVISGEKYI